MLLIASGFCFYAARPLEKKAFSEIVSQGDCVESFENETLVLKEEHFSTLDFSQNKLSYFFLMESGSPKVFMVSDKKVVVQTHNFDNGPDDFKEGLARTIRYGKYGFINDDLDVVIPPEYDFAFPFEKK